MYLSCCLLCVTLCCFFFSSRRRHTRLQGDWSSDVCSSDLGGRGDSVAVVGENSRNLPRTAYPVLSRTPIHRVRGGRIGIIRRRREATALARSQTVAGGGAGFCGKHVASDGAGGSILGRGACGDAVDGRLGSNSRYGRGSERPGGGKVRFSGSVAGAVGSLYRNSCWHHGKLADGSGSSNRARTPVQKDCIHRFLGFRADLVRGRPICDADFGAALEVG